MSIKIHIAGPNKDLTWMDRIDRMFFSKSSTTRLLALRIRHGMRRIRSYGVTEKTACFRVLHVLHGEDIGLRAKPALIAINSTSCFFSRIIDSRIIFLH
jgi:hypothetical protein